MAALDAGQDLNHTQDRSIVLDNFIFNQLWLLVIASGGRSGGRVRGGVGRVPSFMTKNVTPPFALFGTRKCTPFMGLSFLGQERANLQAPSFETPFICQQLLLLFCWRIILFACFLWSRMFQKSSNQNQSITSYQFPVIKIENHPRQHLFHFLANKPMGFLSTIFQGVKLCVS